MKEMNKATAPEPDKNSTATKEQPGFFGRILQKLDNTLKQKAEEKSGEDSCCGGSDNKGGKCC